MPIINPDLLQKQKDLNKDSYGGACVAVAENILKHLDSYEGDEFNVGYSPDMTTPHGIITKCDNQGGITGFMAGAARNIVLHCHTLGWKFWITDVISPYELNNPERLDAHVDKLVACDTITASREEIRKYVDGLVERYPARNPAKEVPAEEETDVRISMTVLFDDREIAEKVAGNLRGAAKGVVSVDVKDV